MIILRSDVILRRQEMPVFDEKDSGINDIEEFPAYGPTRGKPKKEAPKGTVPGAMKKIPILTIIFIVLIVLVGVMTLSIAARVSTLSGEIGEVKAIKSQLATVQTSLDASIQSANNERNKLKSEIAQLQSDLDVMKALQRHQAEAAVQKQAALQKQAEEAKKKAVPAKKPAQKEKRL